MLYDTFEQPIFKIMLFIILTILMTIYFASIPVVRKRKFGLNVIKTLRILILIATPILVATITAQSYNIYPRWYWFTKGIFWLVFFSCMAIFGLCKSDLLGKFERTIYRIIFYFPLVSLLLLLVPFIGIGVGLIFYVQFVGDNKFVLYSDNKIRIEQPFIRFMGPNPQPIVYVKQKLTSYQDTTLPIGYDDVKDTVEVKISNDSTYNITFKSPNNWQVPTGTQSFLYNLKDRHR